jgi:putative transposase
MGLHPNSRGTGKSKTQWAGTVGNVLKRNGIEPAPERSKHTPGRRSCGAHWETLTASDFFTVELWTVRGLVTQYLLFVISLADRIVMIAGITTRPDETWMLQIARNVTDPLTGVMHGKRYLVMIAMQNTRRKFAG